MNSPACPPLDTTRFQWRRTNTDPSIFQREVFGVEALADYRNRYLYGDGTLFLGVTLDFHCPVSLSGLARLAREAWMLLRFEVPTISAFQTTNRDTTLLNYTVPMTFGDARRWAERTVRTASNVDVEELRYQLGSSPLPDSNGDMTFLYVVGQHSQASGLLLHASHVLFDPQGLLILMRRYLRKLAPMIAGDLVPNLSLLEWGKEVPNLLPCVASILVPREAAEGPAYSASVQRVLSDFRAGMNHLYPLRARRMERGPTYHVKQNFSKEESDHIKTTAKSYGCAVTELFHATLCLVITEDNPPTDQTPPNTSFVFHGWQNCRPTRLVPPFSAMDGYPGMATAMSMLIIPGVDMLRGKSTFFNKTPLLAMVDHVRREYKRQRECPALLAMQGHLFDTVLPPAKRGAIKIVPPMLPLYIDDGIYETYIDRSYVDRKGRGVLSIESIFSSQNRTDPGPIFHLGSWKGRIQLSVDFNGSAMPTQAVDQMVDNWTNFARLILS
ncbi:hypothetical protein DACRYDRAFT_113276 [Dacryopinax primogenitus]|uniref:CoA-dependent acyltransferase n=1 Tax=Dacryopinax primogenitus (strain DJM 731) TaxID=1858805 RepID=M5GFV4_DACPD|nr:uncharacterized protein DACRYDRAFT_113276 [Dacryopinax primogenitus]EJU06612.1 hypothetical protein DACRYDRAFT_113276 [Dacryopinax primogenitus]